jgi:hypothetical protein
MSFTSPDELNRFVSQLRQELEAAGFREASRRLGRVQGVAFTTGSEWLGELGIAVKGIRGECAVPPELDAKLERVLAAVRRVWPVL